MRSSKSRSRSKSNRSRSIGNIVNRVFDSSGPEGKVRGTPQQIIDKYLMLARDAQLSNDRVAAENFLQHAEHYTRMLGEAQRELQREQEARQHQNGHDRRDQNSGRDDADTERAALAAEPEPEPERVAGVIDLDDDQGDSGLVETPETRSDRPEEPVRTEAGADIAPQAAAAERGPRRAPRKPRSKSGAAGESTEGGPNAETSAAG